MGTPPNWWFPLGVPFKNTTWSALKKDTLMWVWVNILHHQDMDRRLSRPCSIYQTAGEGVLVPFIRAQ